MAGVRKEPQASGKYQAWYYDYSNKRIFFIGTKSRNETLRMAQRFEDEHRQVKLGYRPASTKADKVKSRPFSELAKEYLAWGESKGGRNGMPWGEVHARMRKTHLNWWEENLELQVVGDLHGLLPRVEAALRKLQKEGRTGKTLQNYSEAICALCKWAVERGYLAHDPLERLSGYDSRPKSNRRAMSEEEIQRLLQVAPPDRRMLYQVALCTGLRAKELRSLKVRDLNLDFNGLNLHAEWTKNRKQGIQPIPSWLINRLVKKCNGKELDDPLLYVPSHPARELDTDLEAAGIPKWTPEGKVDFHSFRVVFISRVVEAGATVKEAQTLARHSTPDMTLNVYAKTSPKRLSGLAEKISESIAEEEMRAPSVQKQIYGDERTPEKAIKSNEIDGDEQWWRRRESNPKQCENNFIQNCDIYNTSNEHNLTESEGWTDSEHSLKDTSQTSSEQIQDTFMHEKRANSVHMDNKHMISPQINGDSKMMLIKPEYISAYPELKAVIWAWAYLPDPVKAGIMAMITSAVPDAESFTSSDE